MSPFRTTSRRISHLLLDFDETLTEKDTISLLAAAVYSLRPASVVPPWSYFVEAYRNDCRQYQTPTHPQTGTLIQKEIQSLHFNLPVEKASIERIEAKGVFRGLHLLELGKSAANTVKVRDGFWDQVIKPALEDQVDISIISVNWSSIWIREALKAAVVKEGGDKNLLELRLKIYCNDLLVDDDGITNGMFSRFFKEQNEGIWTAQHKHLVMQQIKKEVAPGNGLVVYVGDSSTDLQCLHAADVGIVIGDKLDKVCEKIGINLIDGAMEAPFPDIPLDPDALVKVNDLRGLARYIGLNRK